MVSILSGSTPVYRVRSNMASITRESRSSGDTRIGASLGADSWFDD